MGVFGLKASTKLNPAYWYEKFVLLPMSAKLAIASTLAFAIYLLAVQTEELSEKEIEELSVH